MTANVLRQATGRMNVALLALNWIAEDTRKEYYSTLDKEDLRRNIEALFNNLSMIHTTLMDEVMELEELRERLEKADNVQ